MICTLVNMYRIMRASTYVRNPWIYFRFEFNILLTKELFEQIYMENDETQYTLYVLLLHVCAMKKLAVKTLNLSPSVPVL